MMSGVERMLKTQRNVSNSKIQCIVIDDETDSEDEIIDLINNQNITDLNGKNKKRTESDIINSTIQEINVKNKKIPHEIEVTFPSQSCEEGTKKLKGDETLEIRNGCDKQVDCTIQDTSTRTYNGSQIEGSGLELLQVFNERIKVKCNKEGTSSRLGVIECASDNDLDHVSKYESGKNLSVEKKTDGSDLIGTNRANGSRCSAEISVRDVPSEDETKNSVESVTISKEVWRISNSENREQCNLHMKNRHDTDTDNDVITKTFKTGKRPYVWEQLKTKVHVPSQKKVIYPTVITENITKDKETNIDGAGDDGATGVEAKSPLFQLQESLENQIKDLVSTIQNLHTVEKKAILEAITHTQQCANKDDLESLVDILIKKKVNCQEMTKECSVSLGNEKRTSDGKTVQHQEYCGKEGGTCQEQAAHRLESSVTVKNFNKTSAGVTSSQFGKNTYDQVTAQAASNGSEHPIAPNNFSKPTKENNTISGRSSNKVGNKVMDSTKKKNAPSFSMLKTPVRRRKPPLPFSEKSHSDVEVITKQPTRPNTRGGSFALLREILKDCSSSSIVSLDSKQDTPETENLPVVITGTGKEEDKREDHDVDFKVCTELDASVIICESIKNSSDDGNLAAVYKADNKPTDVENFTSAKVALKKSILRDKQVPYECSKFPANTLDNYLRTEDVKRPSNKHTNSISLAKHLPPKLSLDERLSRMREGFINSENHWLYDGKESDSTSDDTLRNAEKVLEEAKIRSRMLSDNDYLKYDDIHKYFDKNPYLMKSDILEIKKNVNKNINKLSRSVQKEIESNASGKDKRLPLKEKNVCTVKFRR